MTIITTTRPTTSNARAALLILEHAERTGLPEPQHVTVDDTGYIAFGFAALADMTDWALWMESTIDETTLISGQLHRSARGEALEQYIQVWHVQYTDEPAEAVS